MTYSTQIITCVLFFYLLEDVWLDWICLFRATYRVSTWKRYPDSVWLRREFRFIEFSVKSILISVLLCSYFHKSFLGPKVSKSAGTLKLYFHKQDFLSYLRVVLKYAKSWWYDVSVGKLQRRLESGDQTAHWAGSPLLAASARRSDSWFALQRCLFSQATELKSCKCIRDKRRNREIAEASPAKSTTSCQKLIKYESISWSFYVRA